MKAYGWVNKNQGCFTKWKIKILGFIHRYNIPQESRSNDIVLTLMHSLAEPDKENCCSKLLLLYFNESIQNIDPKLYMSFPEKLSLAERKTEATNMTEVKTHHLRDLIRFIGKIWRFW